MFQIILTIIDLPVTPQDTLEATHKLFLPDKTVLLQGHTIAYQGLMMLTAHRDLPHRM